MLFWIIIAAMALAVAALIGRAMMRATLQSSDLDDAAHDMQVYKNQLAEVDRDRARGTIPDDEAERLRAEIARRLISADSRTDTDKSTKTSSTSKPLKPKSSPRYAVLAMIGALLILLPLGLYAFLGAPGYGDLSRKDRLAAAQERRETRPSQAEAEASVPAGALVPQGQEPPAEFVELIEKLRQAVAARPDDLQGHRLLARNEAALGNFRAGASAQEKALSLAGGNATAEDYMTYADLLILSAAGYVSPEAERALRAALARDPENGGATYYMGLMMRQTGRPDLAFRVWDKLLRAGPEEAEWIAPIRAQIDDVARLAGVEYEQPRPAESLAGPTAEDMANAQDMSAEDRQEMVRGMVARLSDRLASQGGSPAEWARLIRAYGVLGDVTRARAIADEAQQVFAANPAALAQITAAAQSLPQTAPTATPATTPPTAETSPNSDTGPNTGPDTGPNTGPDTGSNTGPNTGTPTTGTAPTTTSDTAPSTPTGATTAPASSTDSGPNTDPDTDPDTDPNAAPDSAPNTAPNTDPNTATPPQTEGTSE